MDRFSKSTHFIPIRTTNSASDLAPIYVREIVRLHGVPKTIVSDRDAKFGSMFWKSLQDALGTKLQFSTAFHPQTDGQSERTIQTLEDMLRSCVLSWKGSWEDQLELVEFAYNNSYHSSVRAAPFEVLYRRKCRSPLCWDAIGEKAILGLDWVQQTVERVAEIRQNLLAAQSRQKSYADVRRRDLEFEVGDQVLLRVSPTKRVVRFGTKGKLSPRYIGQFPRSQKGEVLGWERSSKRVRLGWRRRRQDQLGGGEGESSMNSGNDLGKDRNLSLTLGKFL